MDLSGLPKVPVATWAVFRGRLHLMDDRTGSPISNLDLGIGSALAMSERGVSMLAELRAADCFPDFRVETFARDNPVFRWYSTTGSPRSGELLDDSPSGGVWARYTRNGPGNGYGPDWYDVRILDAPSRRFYCPLETMRNAVIDAVREAKYYGGSMLSLLTDEARAKAFTTADSFIHEVWEKGRNTGEVSRDLWHHWLRRSGDSRRIAFASRALVEAVNERGWRGMAVWMDYHFRHFQGRWTIPKYLKYTEEGTWMDGMWVKLDMDELGVGEDDLDTYADLNADRFPAGATL